MEGFHDGNDIRLTAPAIRRRRCLSGSGSKRITVDRQNAGWRPSLCKPLTLQPDCGEEGTEAFPPEASVHNHGSCSTVPGIPGAGFLCQNRSSPGRAHFKQLCPRYQKINLENLNFCLYFWKQSWYDNRAGCDQTNQTHRSVQGESCISVHHPPFT